MRGVNDLSMMMKFVMCLGWYMLSGQGQQDRGEQVLQANNALGQWMKAQSMDEGQRRYKPPIPAEAEQATTTFRQLKQKCMMSRCLKRRPIVTDRTGPNDWDSHQLCFLTDGIGAKRFLI